MSGQNESDEYLYGSLSITLAKLSSFEATIRPRLDGGSTSDVPTVTPTCVGGGGSGDAASKIRPSAPSWRANGTGPGDCIIPPTPQRRRAGGFAKLLELTPLWQQALQYRRLPPGLDRERLFAELTCRLRDAEWEVRQHALRVLVDLAPVLDTSDATRLASAGVIADVADNLGHAAPGVRGGATEALLALATVPGSDVAVILALGKRLVQVTLQEASVRTLASIRGRIGNDRFDHLLSELPPQQRRDFDSLSHVYGVDSPTDNGLPERSAGGDSGIDLRMPESEDSSDTDRIVMKTEIKFDEHTAITMTVLEQDSDGEGSPDEIEHQDEQDNQEDDEEDGDLSTRSRRRVRFGGEIVKMRTPDSDAANESASRDRSSSSSGEESVHQGSPPRSPTPSPSLSPNLTPSPSRSPTLSPHSQSPPVQSPSPPEDEPPPVVIPSPPRIESPNLESSPPPPIPPPAHTVPLKSHIPVPITPARRLSQTKLRPESPTEKRRHDNGVDMDAEAAGIPNMDGGESLTCSSSEGEATVPVLDHVNPALLEDLYGGDARAAERALQQIQDSIYREDYGDSEECVRLLAGLLGERRSPAFVQTTLACFKRLFEVLPLGQVLSSLNTVVPALCRHIGGGCGGGADGALGVRLEAAAAARALMVAVGPGPVVQIALSPLGLGAHSSKIRESALLLLLHATMAFPSRSVDAQRAAKLAAMALADARRRVRQAALDSLAALAQFLAPAALGAVLRDAANAAALRKGDQSAGAGLMAAAHSRLARRQLPILGRNGLILYALELQPLSTSPSHRPKGADVDWIMAGTGSLSSGSARSRHQLMASPPAHSFYNGPIGSAQSVPLLRSSSTKGRLSLCPGNPWTERRPVAPVIGTSVRNTAPLNSPLIMRSNQTFNQRPDSLLKEERHRFGSKAAPNNHWTPGKTHEVDPYMFSAHGRQPVLLRSPLDGHYTMSTHQYGSGFSLLPSRLNQTWPPPTSTTLPSTTTTTTSTTTSANITQQSTNFQPPESATHWKGRILEPLPLDRTVATTRKRSSAGSDGRYEMPPLPHSHPAARPPFNGSPERVSSSDVSGRPIRGSAAAVLVNGRHAQRQPITLVPTSLHKETNSQGILPGIAPADTYVTDIPAIAPATPVRRQPVQDSPSNFPLHPPTPPPKTPSPLDNRSPSPSPLNHPKEASPTPESPPSPSPKSPTPPPPPASPPSSTPESRSPQRDILVALTATSEPDLTGNAIPELSNGDILKDHDAPIEETAARQQQAQQRRRRRTEPSSAAVAVNGGLPARSSSGPRRPLRAPNSVRSSFSRSRQSEGDWSTPESLSRCLQQLDGADWEAAAAALRTLARQLITSTGNNGTVHFGAAAQVQARLHVVCEALARQVRNLRSQVARAACDAAKSLFLTFRRGADTETEDLVAALFHRTADTNKFLRADSNAALDAMADSLSPGRAVSIIVYKGCRHQNAIVRAEGARLLLRMVDNLGIERIMSQPRETRDILLITATRLLTEGSLEARSYAKSLLRTLSRDPHLLAILIEIVPANVMRNIDKTLKSLIRK